MFDRWGNMAVKATPGVTPVKKNTDSLHTCFVYDAFGQLAAEYSSTDPAGATETHYLTTDHLGSTRLVTNQNGAVVSRHDYLPFGWELYSGLTGRTSGHGYLTSPEGVPTPTQRFTGKERDSETRLDYFGARYYTAGPGRFTSADPKLTSGRPEDPQTWNRYSYVTNNPLRLIDPDGRDKWEAFLQSARAWWDEMWRPAAGMASGSVEPPSGNTPSGPGFDNSQVARRHAEEVGKGTTLLKDIVMLADVSGAGGMLEAGMRRDGAGTGLAIAGAAIPGGGGKQVGYSSFGKLKSAIGSAGEGNVWHHVVEQSKIGQFGEQAIHNTGNVVAVAQNVNQKLANYYSSRRDFTQGKTVREWLKGKSWKEQYEFGLARLNDALKDELR